uniref:Putative reverse transcriptase domain-containing protein n=1 Tax=Tanacetum cinerariifolium TaxID=118510 RepID=A0A6L2MMI7_TANCI|nr:putative reverse transcriptase domain-containing protein [Tanacetum cinerariifolium]
MMQCMSILVKIQDRKVEKMIKIKDKDLKILDEMTTSKDNNKGSRSKIAKHVGTSLQRVANALAARDADRSENGEDSHDSGTVVRRQAPPARVCTNQDFMKCKPLYFKGTEGVVELTQWFERMKIMFRIRNCTVENQIKFATCTLLGSALTLWNSQIKTVGLDVAYAMTWHT